MPTLTPTLLPTLCAVCRRWTRGARMCGDCRQQWMPHRTRCTACGLVLPAGAATRCLPCASQPPGPLDMTRVALDYAFPWDGLIAAFKFGGRIDLSGLLADALRPVLQAAGAFTEVDAVLPVPLGPQRLRERGYNQALSLARGLAAGTPLPVLADSLRRVRETDAQTGLEAAERRRNLRHAFWVPRPETVSGRRLALVDDVMTTGATAREAAATLRAAGAVAVQLWVVARTPAPGGA